MYHRWGLVHRNCLLRQLYSHIRHSRVSTHSTPDLTTWSSTLIINAIHNTNYDRITINSCTRKKTLSSFREINHHHWNWSSPIRFTLCYRWWSIPISNGKWQILTIVESNVIGTNQQNTVWFSILCPCTIMQKSSEKWTKKFQFWTIQHSDSRNSIIIIWSYLGKYEWMNDRSIDTDDRPRWQQMRSGSINRGQVV